MPVRRLSVLAIASLVKTKLHVGDMLIQSISFDFVPSSASFYEGKRLVLF
jgi:hypothetical protein